MLTPEEFIIDFDEEDSVVEKSLGDFTGLRLFLDESNRFLCFFHHWFCMLSPLHLTLNSYHLI